MVVREASPLFDSPFPFTLLEEKGDNFFRGATPLSTLLIMLLSQEDSS
jgi:hypothetical protein